MDKKLDEIVEEISKRTKKDKNTIIELVQKKQQEFGGLITPEGAAHVVAKEMGINLLELPETKPIKINEIKANMNNLTLIGRISQVSKPREFERQDGSKGKVANIEILDETSSIRVVLWGKDVDYVRKLKEGDIVKIKGAYSKEGLTGVECHLGRFGSIEVDPDIEKEPPQVEIPKTIPISDVEVGMDSVNIQGKVIWTSEIREFEREGRTGRAVTLIVGDETGTIPITLWDSDVKLVEDGYIDEGSVIKVFDAYSREGLRGPELHLGWRGRIFVEEEKDLEEVEIVEREIQRVSINDITQEGFYEIRGMLIHLYDRKPLYHACPICKRGARQEDGEFVCENCGKIEPEPRLVISGMIDDGTANIKVVFFGKVAEDLLKIKAEELEDSIKKDSEIFEIKKEEILGKEYILSGKTNIDDFTGQLEFRVGKISDVNPLEEAKVLVEELDLDG
ncbi:MAG: DUF2240 family protein [Candidatus Hydrothermarchaeota archaeon]